MADILIKNIEIDEGCYYCPFLLRKNNCFCAITSSTIRIDEVRENDDARMDDCPIIFLPEHGRLCDLDALIEHETYNIEQVLFDTDEVLEDLKNAPVIVEANNGYNN